MSTPNKRSIDNWNGVRIQPGEHRDLSLQASESSSGLSITFPLHVKRGREPGPAIFVTAALHGDEINGTGAVRILIQNEQLQLKRGTLVLVPVVNPLAFDRHSRYMPDRRDLNRCFPGSSGGSLSARMARIVFDEIVRRCDFGIDLHTAALRRTNYPNIRGDLVHEKVQELAEAFGCQLIINGRGPKNSLREEATNAGCPVVTFEGGEVWKVEPAIAEAAVRGVQNVLTHFDMIEGEAVRPAYQMTIDNTKWIRADRGGFLQFHISPGEIVRAGQSLATNASLLGHERNVLTAPFDSVVMGMTTLPTVSPGEPVCHLGEISESSRKVELIRKKLETDEHHGRMVDDLASNVMVVEREEDG